jgi:hypothetical protein
MNRLILGTALALATSVGLAAQQSTTKTQTKVDVKDGKNVTVTGCVDRAASGQGFVLTRVESGGTPSPFYALVGEDSSRTTLKRRQREVVAFVRSAMQPPSADERAPRKSAG